MKNMKTAAGMLCLAGILSLGMGTTVFAEDGDSHYPVTITTYNYENEPVEMTLRKLRRKYLHMQTPISKSFWHLVSVIRS